MKQRASEMVEFPIQDCCEVTALITGPLFCLYQPTERSKPGTLRMPTVSWYHPNLHSRISVPLLLRKPRWRTWNKSSPKNHSKAGNVCTYIYHSSRTPFFHMNWSHPLPLLTRTAAECVQADLQHNNNGPSLRPQRTPARPKWACPCRLITMCGFIWQQASAEWPSGCAAAAAPAAAWLHVQGSTSQYAACVQVAFAC